MPQLPDIIQRYITAYNARDVSAILATLTDDIRFLNLTDGTVTAQADGKEDFAALAEFGARAFRAREQRVISALSVHDTTLTKIEFTGTVALDLPNGWQAGQTVNLQGATLFRLRGGLICRLVDEA